MYQKEEVERLAKEYVDTGKEQVFEKLIEALIPVIDVQLGKNYSSLKEFWGDLRQDVVVHLYSVRGNIQNTTLESKYFYLYGVIREILYRFTQGKKYKNRYKFEIEKSNEITQHQLEEITIQHSNVTIIEFDKNENEKSRKTIKPKPTRRKKGELNYLSKSLKLIKKQKRINFERQMVGND